MLFAKSVAPKTNGANPAPGNLWLKDKDATWWITSQGEFKGPDAVGADRAPQESSSEYVDYGNGHGYGCACLNVESDGRDKITKVISGRTLPLAQCKADKRLPPPADSTTSMTSRFARRVVASALLALSSIAAPVVCKLRLIAGSVSDVTPIGLKLCSRILSEVRQAGRRSAGDRGSSACAVRESDFRYHDSKNAGQPGEV